MTPDAGTGGIEVLVEGGDWDFGPADAPGLARRAAEAALAAADARGGLAILLADANPGGWLGDVALAFETCRGEAEAQDKRFEHHLQHLVAHGVLHLVGYDHETDEEAAEMEGLETEILAGLGAPDPYAAERGDHGQS